jgi:hypothetical protein
MDLGNKDSVSTGGNSSGGGNDGGRGEEEGDTGDDGGGNNEGDDLLTLFEHECDPLSCPFKYIDFHKEKTHHNEPKNSNLMNDNENISTLYETGVFMQWWKPIPFVSPIISGIHQYIKDDDMDYALDTQMWRIGIVIIEDDMVQTIAAVTASSAMGLAIETGPGSIVVGATTY